MSKENKKVYINTTVTYDTNGIAFHPPDTDFLTQFEKILSDMLSVTSEVQRIISFQNFSQFVQGLVSDSGPKFKQIVEGSFAYRTTKDMIQQKITNDFKKL
jgi:hypothetical protein